MDSIWRPEDYRPSAPDSENTGHVRLGCQQLSPLLQRGQKLSQSIQSSPYDPMLWFERGNTLLALGFLELAMGDFFKAELLCEDSLEARSRQRGSTEQRRGYEVLAILGEHFFGVEGWQAVADVPNLIFDPDGVALLYEFVDHLRFSILRALVITLLQARCFQDAIRIADRALALSRDGTTAAEFGKLRVACEELLDDCAVEYQELHRDAREIATKSGCVYRRVYPWMTERHLTRSPQVIQGLQSELDAASGPGTCILRPSSTNQDEADQPDDYSVFAGRDIAKGEQVLVDDAMIAVLGTPSAGTHFCDHCFASPSNPTIKAHCCDTQFCSAACLDTSLSTYHPLLCKTDLSFLYANQSDHVLNPTLLLPRLLSSYLSSSPPDTHPLSHPLLSRWKPDYRSTSPRGLAPPRFPISFATHIEQPNQIMAALGVDIFSDARFDTWVLQNLLNRVSANAHVRHPRPQHHSAPFQATAAPSETTSDPPDLIRAAAAAASSATVHNIGCLLPLLNHSCTPNVVIGEGRGGVWARAWRDIREGEELCVSYVDGAGKGAGKEEQRQSLAVWFNECLCESCRAEKKEASGISVRLNQGDERDSLETGTTR